MDTTVTGIGSVVVAELRAAGYLESTIGQYARTIKVLARFAAVRGSNYPDRTFTGRRRRAYEQQAPLLRHSVTSRSAGRTN